MHEKISVCCMACKDVYDLNGGMFTRNKPRRCKATEERVDAIPSLDNNLRSRYEDENKMMKLIFDDDQTEELTGPFITKKNDMHFLIYDNLKIGVDKFRDRVTQLEFYNFMTNKKERMKNMIFDFPEKSLEDDRKIYSFRCGKEGETDEPEMIFDVSVVNLKTDSRQYDFVDVITRVMIRYPLWALH